MSPKNLSIKPKDALHLKDIVQTYPLECCALIGKAVAASGLNPNNEDYIQDNFAVVLSKIDKFDPLHDVMASTFIYSIAYQHSRNLQKQLCKRPKPLSLNTDLHVSITYDWEAQNELIEFELNDYIESINNPIFKEILHKYLIEKKTYTQISNEMSISISQVSDKLNLWKQYIKENYYEYCVW